MRFSYKQGETVGGKLSYINQDRSIDFEPSKNIYKPRHHGSSAAMVISKTLQIEFLIDSGRLLYIWGYLPKESWQYGGSQLSIKEVRSGVVFVSEVSDMVMPGSAYSTNLESAPTHHYQESGHLLIGELKDVDALVEIATDTIVGLKGDQLCCIVLKPGLRD